MAVREWDCRDCGRHIVSYWEGSTPLCMSCAWIRGQVPPEHQAAARERLGVPLRQADG